MMKKYSLSQDCWMEEPQKSKLYKWNLKWKAFLTEKFERICLKFIQVVKESKQLELYTILENENMYKGYNEEYGKTEKSLSFDQFYYLSNMGDLQDLWPSVGQVETLGIGNCNSFYKPGIMAHTTFNVYQTRLRIYKSYNFKLNDKEIINQHISFTARPGDLLSKDDFFVLWDTKMVVTETSFNNYNKKNYEFYNYQTVPCWMRVKIASRLAKNPQEWLLLLLLLLLLQTLTIKKSLMYIFAISQQSIVLNGQHQYTFIYQKYYFFIN